MNTIRDQIMRLRVKNADDKQFIPDGSLASCLPRETIFNLLRDNCNVETYRINEMADMIEKGARKVFAILILIDKATEITKFAEHHLHFNRTLDDQIPYTKYELKTIFFQEPLRSDYFEEWQWEFVAPIFRQRLSHQIFPNEIRLPFIENHKLAQGGFGQVYRVVIPPGHHDFEEIDPAKDAVIVRKQLEGNDAWNNTGSNEHKIMCHLHHFKHANILPLLGSYIYKDVPNFLFPLATGGDLDSFLKAKFKPKEFSEKASFYLALSGLASALHKLQNFKFEAFGTEMIGYHHDLKPKNVLVSDSRFILSDFGLSRLKTGDNSKTPFKIGQGHYLAPECEDAQNDFAKGVVSRASDIWSFGCIVLEVIVLMARSPDYLAEFRQRRKFKNGRWTTSTFFRGDCVNEVVVSELEELIADESDTVRMVASLVRQILVMDPNKRLKANEIAIRLHLIYLEASIQSMSGLKGILGSVAEQSIDERFDTFHTLTRTLASGEGALAQEALDPETLKSLAGPRFLPSFLENLKKLKPRNSQYEQIRDSILDDLQTVNDFLAKEFTREQAGEDSIKSEQREITISPRSPSKISRDLPEVNNLRAGDFVIEQTGRKLIISNDDKWLAIEKDWKIVVYALPSVEKAHVIELPTHLSPYLCAWGAEWPYFKFSPDGQHLIVSWILEVYSYPVGRATHAPIRIFSRFVDGDLNANQPIGHQLDKPAYGTPVQLGEISQDSSKIALFWANRLAWVPPTDLRLTVVGGINGHPSGIRAIVSDLVNLGEQITGFSSDGNTLAVSMLVSIQHEGQTVVPVRLLDCSGELPGPLTEWTILPITERFSFKRPLKGIYFHRPVLSYPQVVIGVNAGCWVTGVWGKSERRLDLYNLTAPGRETLKLSSFDAIPLELKDAVFSGDLTIIGCRFKQSRFRMPKIRKDRSKASKNTVAFADTKTDRIFCFLEDFSFDDYLISNSGQYAATVKYGISQIKIFRILAR